MVAWPAWRPRRSGEVPEEVRALAAAARRAAFRLRCTRCLEVATRVQAAGVAGLLVLSLARLVIPVDLAVLPLLWLALGGGVVSGVLYAWIRPVSAVGGARVLDRRGRLGERVSTALEVTTGRGASRAALAPLLVRDAAAHLQRVEIGRLLPVRPPRRVLWVAAGAAVLLVWQHAATGVTLPGTRARHVVQTIRQEGERLERVGQQLAARARSERAPETSRLARQIREMGARLRRERLERAEALARVQDLSRQAELARQRIADRITRDQGAPSPERQGTPPLPSFARRQALERQIRQIQELTSRLRQRDAPDSREDLLQRLDNLSRAGGEGTMPTQANRRLAEARQQLRQGNASAAASAMDEALADLEGMRRLLSDEEGLGQAQQQLGQTVQRIARGTPSAPGPQTAEQEGQVSPTSRAVRGDNPPAQQEGKEEMPPQGPNLGTTPGQGRVADKLGDPTTRLGQQKEQSRLRGRQSEGQIISGEVLAPGRRGTPDVRVQPVSASAAREADRHLQRSAVPGPYREIVRRYFEGLSTLGGGR